MQAQHFLFSVASWEMMDSFKVIVTSQLVSQFNRMVASLLQKALKMMFQQSKEFGLCILTGFGN